MLEISLDYIPSCNIALQQNSAKILRELKIISDSQETLENLHVSITSTPALTLPLEFDISRLEGQCSFQELEAKLNYDMLISLTDAIKSVLEIKITQGENLLLAKEFELTGYAPDQWLGSDIIPEHLASFVCPNMEAVGALVTLVGDELKKFTDSATINGYNDGKQRAYDTIKATFNAIHSLGITYALTAPSTGQIGQRVRMPDYIFKYRHANCLDATLLMASVLEACRLAPVIMLTEDHAYIGCHLTDETFADLPSDDLQKIRKLVKMDEFVVCEPTMAGEDNATFEKAEQFAIDNHLQDDSFSCAIDVLRARESKIYPLPFKSTLGEMVFDEGLARERETVVEDSRALQEKIDLTQFSRSDNSSRTDVWQKKLLDFSLRNRLLNIRTSAQIVPLVCGAVSDLEDTLSSKTAVAIGSIDDLLSEKDYHDIANNPSLQLSNELKTMLDAELGKKRIWAITNSLKLSNSLTKIYRQAKTDIEEGGINTLFLAIGALEWKVSERDNTSMIAPLLLMPVKLIRPTICEPFKLQRLEDDTLLNHTLVEMLSREFKMDIPLDDDLPKDEQGVDVKKIMQIFREITRDMKGWEVHEYSCIGLFSFAKYNLWYDMAKKTDQLMESPIVAHIASGSGIFDDGIQVSPDGSLGAPLDLSKIYCPMNADSSQLAAVMYSQTGKNFVLHGPPGTGKSQTITNIIAHNLALGRRVLFVSEKKAALEVVHRRLSQIGLRPFCLELHSNKSGKNEVYAQFEEVLSVPDTQEPQEWSQTIAALASVRDELNAYVNALHTTYPNGISAYDCFARLIGKGGIHLHLEANFLEQTREALASMSAAVTEFATAASRMDLNTLGAFNMLAPEDWSPIYQRALIEKSTALSATIQELMDATEAFSSAGMPALQNASLLKGMKGLLPLMTTAIPSQFFSPDYLQDPQFLAAFVENASKLQTMQKELSKYELEKVVEIDLDSLEKRVKENNAKFFIMRYFANSALTKELAPIKRLGSGKLTAAELECKLPKFKQYKALHEVFSKDAGRAEKMLGDMWDNGLPDCAKISDFITRSTAILDALKSFVAPGTDDFDGITAALGNIMPAPEKYKRTMDAFSSCLDKFQTALAEFIKFCIPQNLPEDISDLDFSLCKLKEHESDIRNALFYIQCRGKLRQMNIGALVDAFEQKTIAAQAITQVFDDSLHNDMLESILATVPELAKFSGLKHNDRIKLFRQLDNRYINLTRHYIKSLLTSRLPRRRGSECPEGTELGLLQREIKKKSRQMAIKKLLEKIRPLLPSIKPCFLMSPLSVAQYLPLESEKFDLVVFDEASQIPVWDAIGTIARGKQLIVVGDPKQMPPTNFFQKTNSTEEDSVPEEDEDTESILDECLAAGIFSSYLSWHYRSRHESLIAFSNHYYYDDKLLTFPSASRSSKLGVSFHKVEDAIYDRKHSRTNAKEADALVDYVFGLLNDPETRDKSIGIVTFSQTQKDLIEDKLEAMRLKNPSLDEYFSDESDEPLFVKNLENVQGDERDIIIFSICYAKDEKGIFAMNFGPLNRAGGERRLNVAITRAKEQVVVFSSVDSSMIDLGRTQAIGSAHLKYFLEYAQNGGIAFGQTAASNKNKDAFLATVTKVIEAAGYKVTQSLGCSDFKVDLAVSSPDNQDSYIAGVICDGYSYSMHKTARDRDNTMDSVLTSLGWKLVHTWSMDWAFDRAHAEEDLLKAIREPASTSKNAPEPKLQDSAGAPPPVPSSSSQGDNLPEYQVWSEKIPANAEFTAEKNITLIQRQLQNLIELEAPVRETLVKKRLFKAWGITRTSQQVLDVYNRCLPAKVLKVDEDGGTVFWTVPPEDYNIFRVPGNTPESRRAIDEIPAKEIAAAFKYIQQDFNSCPEDVLFRETIRLFGFTALTEKMRNILSKILHG